MQAFGLMKPPFSHFPDFTDLDKHTGRLHSSPGTWIYLTARSVKMKESG